MTERGAAVMTTTNTVKYIGSIPRTLRAYADKHADQIQEVTWESGYCDNGAYDAFLRPGWRALDDIVHTLISPTATGLIGQLRYIVPCDCAECEELKCRA